MTVARARRKASATLAAASAAADAVGPAATDGPWDDGSSFRDPASGSVAEPVSEGLIRTDGVDMRSPSFCAAAASVAFSSRRSPQSAEAHGDGSFRRSSGRPSEDGKGSRDSTDFSGARRVPSRPRVADSSRRDLARDAPSDPYAFEHGGNSDQAWDSSGGSSDDSASVHEVDLPDVAEPASVFPVMLGAGATEKGQGTPGIAPTARPLVAPLCDEQTSAQWLSDSSAGHPFCATLSVVLSPASGSVAQEPLALRDMGIAGRGRHPSDVPTTQPTPPTGGGSAMIDPAAVAPTAGEVAGSHRRNPHRSRHASASSSGGQPPPSPVNITSPRERSRTAWDASSLSPHRSATPLSPHHRGRKSGGSSAAVALSRRGASVDLQPPSVVVSLDMRASSYAEDAGSADHENDGVLLSTQTSSPLAAAIHASQLVGAGNRFSIASKMRRSPKAALVSAWKVTGAVGEELGVSRSLSTTSNQSGGGSAETNSGGLAQRLIGGARRSGAGADGGGERPTTSFGATFRRAPKYSTVSRPSSPDAPSSALVNGVGSGAVTGTTGTGVVPLILSPGTAGNVGAAALTGTSKAVTGVSKPFFRRFSNVRPGASGTSGRTRGDTSAGGGGVVAAAGRLSAEELSPSGTSALCAMDRAAPVATGGAACVSPTSLSPSEEICASSNGTTTSTLVSAGARSRRKIAKVFFSLKTAAGTPSSSFLNGSSVSISTPFTGALGGSGGAGAAEEDESCTAFTAAVPPSTALAAVSRVLLSAGCDMSVKRDRTVKVKVDAPLGGGLHLHVNVLLEGVAVAGDPSGAQPSSTMHREGTCAETGQCEAHVISATLVRLVRSRDDRGRTPQSEFVAFFHDFHAAFVQATLNRGVP
ncbi:hypothetical protein MMPV_005286 [Pyropia vietnamensis]